MYVNKTKMALSHSWVFIDYLRPFLTEFNFITWNKQLYISFLNREIPLEKSSFASEIIV